jgi:thiaminase/transcriptional activator TenA
MITRTGDYADLLATMLAAEWLYETWCEQTRASPSKRHAIRAWTELHTDPAFTEHAAWLRSSIDALEPAATSSPAQRARLGATFRLALEAEIHFHDAAYDD